MVSQVISFRFSDQEIELLRQQAASPDESTNSIAQRLLREMLGLSTEAFTGVDSLSERVQAIVDARIEAIALPVVDKRIQERLQGQMAALLGELNA
jgi:regulator of protease activity HflC (stomatin/prohibitin superfamily)